MIIHVLYSCGARSHVVSFWGGLFRVVLVLKTVHDFLFNDCIYCHHGHGLHYRVWQNGSGVLVNSWRSWKRNCLGGYNNRRGRLNNGRKGGSNGICINSRGQVPVFCDGWEELMLYQWKRLFWKRLDHEFSSRPKRALSTQHGTKFEQFRWSRLQVGDD